jgi:hypothetical protein
MTKDQLIKNLVAFASTFGMLIALFEIGRRALASKTSVVRNDEVLRWYRRVRFAVGILIGIIWVLAIVRSIHVSAPLFDHGLLQEQFAWLVFLSTTPTALWLLTFGANRWPFVTVAVVAILCIITIYVLGATLAAPGIPT